eukprot:351797_1
MAAWMGHLMARSSVKYVSRQIRNFYTIGSIHAFSTGNKILEEYTKWKKPLFVHGYSQCEDEMDTNTYDAQSEIILKLIRGNHFSKYSVEDTWNILSGIVKHEIPLNFNTTISTWNLCMGIYFKNKEYQKVLDVYHRCRGYKGHDSYSWAIAACKMLKDGEKGTEIHIGIANSDMRENELLNSALMNMYIKCCGDSVYDGILMWREVIKKRKSRGYSKMMIDKCIERKDYWAAFKFFDMDEIPLVATVVSVLDACDEIRLVDEMCKYVKELGYTSCVPEIREAYERCGADKAYIQEKVQRIYGRPLLLSIDQLLSLDA